MRHFFFKGDKDLLSGNQPDKDPVSIIKKELAKVLESRNLSFLIGSGCSTGKHGIPTMAKLAEVFFLEDVKEKGTLTPTLKTLILSPESRSLLAKYKIDITGEPFKSNLEIFLGTLYSLKYYYEQIGDKDECDNVELVITNTKNFIRYQCLNLENTDKDEDILDNYKFFYRKLSLRDSNLPKPNVFTTNYDLYSEKAMDELGITYTNGFSGFIERYFNPSIFNYALAEQMDISSSKWRIIDSFIYLFKIHGSVNWVEETKSNKLFQVKEVQIGEETPNKHLMIYPSPIKQNASLGTPYSDLFREFQKRIAQNQSVLVTMGYSFSDEHINNLIYQALTIPTFRLVVFSELGYYVADEHQITKDNIEKLKNLNDPRIWIIGSDNEFSDDKDWKRKNDDGSLPLYYFERITKELLPDWAENQIEDKNSKIIELMNSVSSMKSDTINDNPNDKR